MIKILILSDSPFLMTGFSNQSREIAKRLTITGDYEVSYLAHNFIGQTIIKSEIEEEKFDFKIIGCGREPYGKDILQNTIKKIRPDILYVLLDSFMLPWIVNYDLAPAKFLMYFPSDGDNFPLNCENVLRKANLPIAMSKFGQQQVKELFNIDAGHIPHATSIEQFFPLKHEEKMNIRRASRIPENAFVIGDVARNQPRKSLDLMIKTFKMFEEKNKDAYLLLHTDPYDSATHFDIISQIRQFGLENKVLFTGMSIFDATPPQRLNEIYNTFDVKFSSTSGEGFGITTIESMACETPQVLTDATCSNELINHGNKSAGLLINTATKVTGTFNVERTFIDIKDACEKLQFIKDNPKQAKKMGMDGRQIVAENYDWNRKVFPIWKKTFKGLHEA